MSILTPEVKHFIYGFFNSMKYEIIEAGCAEGEDTVALGLLPGTRVYGFEPDPRLFGLTKAKCSPLENVKIYNYALSATDGEAEFWIADRFGKTWGASSLLKPKEVLTNHVEITFKQSIKVPTINLDTWLAGEGAQSNVRALWFDLQGSEPDVLRAAPKLLSNIHVLFTEVHLVESYAKGMLWPDFKSWLYQQGFILVCEELPWKDGGNALLVRKQHEEWAKQVANICFKEAKQYIVLK